jgi:hypothetical protein
MAQQPSSLFFSEYRQSSIENRTINSQFPFDYSFWYRKKMVFFTHQHDYRENQDHGILYSINPYR